MIRTTLSTLLPNSPALAKVAGDLTPVQHLAAADASNREAIQQLTDLGLLGVGTGVGIRSLLGFKDMLHRTLNKKRVQPKPAVVEIGVPTLAKEADAPSVPALDASAGKPPALHYSDAPSPTPPGEIGWGDWLAGRGSVGKWGKPWFATAALGVPAAGIYGGYSLVDSLMSGVHNDDRKQELEKAKEEYRKALIEQYTADQVKKGSADDEFNKDLSELASIVKKANVSETTGAIAGMYAPLALLLGGGSAVATYNWAKSRSAEQRVANAIKQRERLRMAARPPEIYAVTKQIPVGIRDTFAEGSDEDKETVKKLAAMYKPKKF